MDINDERLFLNGVDATTTLEAIKKAASSGDFTEAGFKMGDILKLGGEESMAVDSIKDEFKQILGGFLHAIDPLFDSFQIKAEIVCIASLSFSTIASIKIIGLLIQANKNQDQEAIQNALAELMVFYITFGEEYFLCKMAFQFNTSVFSKLKAVMKNPATTVRSVGKSIYFNGIPIDSEVMDALDHYQNGDFEGFGRVLGDTIVTAMDNKLELIN